MTTKQITIAANMFELRDTMKLLHGDKWKDVMADLGTALQLQMKATNNPNPLSAVIPIAKAMSVAGHNPALLMAVAVDMADA